MEGSANRTGNGVVVLILGGEEPHIGAVAIAIPRPSLKDKTKTSATCSVYTLLGHKDDALAKPTAERLARELNEVVVAIAGIHVEAATEEEIRIVTDNSRNVIEHLLQQMKSHR